MVFGKRGWHRVPRRIPSPPLHRHHKVVPGKGFLKKGGTFKEALQPMKVSRHLYELEKAPDSGLRAQKLTREVVQICLATFKACCFQWLRIWQTMSGIFRDMCYGSCTELAKDSGKYAMQKKTELWLIWNLDLLTVENVFSSRGQRWLPWLYKRNHWK